MTSHRRIALRPALRLVFVAAIAGVAWAPAWAAATVPKGWSASLAPDGIERITTGGIDREKAERADIKRYETGERPHFAVALPARIAPDAHGTWDQPDAGTRRWRLRIASPGALSLNFGFGRFVLPPGAELRLVDARGVQAVRAFTAEDNDAHGQLWTPIVAGSEVLLELRVPVQAASFDLRLDSVNHGYRDPRAAPDFVKSGSCNVDVVCPEGDDWRDQIRSSGAITVGGVDTCSGALVNNVAEDLRPFFLTAFHCGISAGEGPTVVVYWNYENSTCRPPGSPASGGPGDGPLNQFNTGAFVRAGRTQSDFALLEMDDPIQSSHNLYWSGIDATDASTPFAIGIHHPGVEEKRISFENEPTSITTYLQNGIPGDGTHLRLTDWDLGTTEPGSSGSPLYSPDKRIIGQLHGGFAACGNDDSDWYGRVAISWTTGGTPETSLRPWLDPANTGTLVINGRNEIEAPFDVTLGQSAVQHCALNGDLVLAVNVSQEEAGFMSPVTLSAPAVPANATTAFSVNPVIPPGASNFTLGNLPNVAAGSHVVQVSGTDGLDTVSRNLALTLFTSAPANPDLLSPADGAVNQFTSPVLTWQAAAQAQGYVVEVDDNADFSSPVYTAAVTGTTATATGLANQTLYFWRVRATNLCPGSGQSAVRSFTTGNVVCVDFVRDDNPDLPIGPDGGTITTSTLNIAGFGGSIVDLDVVGMRGTHTWMADLDVDLTSPAATTLRLFQDLCGDFDNFHLTLDDSAPVGIETFCPTGNPAAAPVVGRPQNALAAFNGQNPNGNWVLDITDDANLDGGLLQRWGLRVCSLGGVAPFVDADNDSYNATEDTTLNVPAPGVLDGDTTSGGTLTATAGTLPAHGTLNLSSNGAFTYAPSSNYCGSDGFTYTASNGAASDTATVSLNVACVNDAPVADNDAYTTAEGTPLTVAAPGVLDGDTDAEGATLAAVLVSGTTNGSLTLNANGGFDYTPGGIFNGIDTFTYRASDGAITSNLATVTITVTSVNVAPVADDDAYSTAEDTTLTLAAPGVLIGDTDGDSDPLTATLVGNVSSGTLALNANGGFVYTPNNDFNGTDTFTYRANDGAASSNLATVTITVTAVNDAPSADNDSYAATEDTPLTVAAPGVLDGDSDVDGPALTATNATQPANGTVSLAADGGFTYMPAGNYCSATPDTFTYQASDGAGGNTTATVSVTVACVNDLPMFTSGPYAFSINEASAAGTTVGTVAASDVEGAVTFSITGGNTGGAFAIAASGQITVASASAVSLANSPFTLQVTASDGQGGSANANVGVTVNDINLAPTVTTPMGDVTLVVGQPFVFDASTAFDDPDGDTLAYSATGLPPSLGIDPVTGIISGTPTAADIAMHTIVVTATDGGGLFITENFTMGVVTDGILSSGFEDP